MMAIRPSERISGNSLAFLSAAGAEADATNTGRRSRGSRPRASLPARLSLSLWLRSCNGCVASPLQLFEQRDNVETLKLRCERFLLLTIIVVLVVVVVRFFQFLPFILLSNVVTFLFWTTLKRWNDCYSVLNVVFFSSFLKCWNDCYLVLPIFTIDPLDLE